MTAAFVTLKLVRSFGIGIIIYPPKLNKLCIEIMLGCVNIMLWNKDGYIGFKFENYWGR